MDLGRLDMMLRSGLWKAVRDHDWTPIASAVTMRYRRELRPFQKFRLETRLVCWDETLVVMEQTFVIDGGDRDGQNAARGLFKGGIYDRKAKAFVAIARLMDAIGVSAASPRPTPEVDAFLHADEQIKRAVRSA
jgi:acyl-CoA thioesterase FadM